MKLLIIPLKTRNEAAKLNAEKSIVLARFLKARERWTSIEMLKTYRMRERSSEESLCKTGVAEKADKALRTGVAAERKPIKEALTISIILALNLASENRVLLSFFKFSFSLSRIT